MKKQIFTIVSSFPSKDEFDYGPDKYYVELGNKRLVEYGDDYHDKGGAKCEGFIEGYSKALNIKYDILYENRVDYTY